MDDHGSLIARLVNTVRRRIAVKLTVTLVAFVALTLLAAGVYVNAALQSFAVDALEDRLSTAARLLQDEARGLVLRDASRAELQAFAGRVQSASATDARVTLVAADGRVLADSAVALDDLDRVENHADRPEVLRALAGKPGRDMRTSETIHERLFYVALPLLDHGRVVAAMRFAIPISTVTAAHAAPRRAMLLGGLVALAVAAGIGVFVSRRITRPVIEMQRTARRMSDGDFAARAPVRSPDEIGRLGRALNVMAAGLRGRLEDLEREQTKVRTILDGMVEGVVAVDGHDQVILMNEPARRMLGLAQGVVEGKPLLEVIRNVDLHSIVRLTRGAVESSPVRRELRLPAAVERIVEVSAMPLRLGAAPLGVVMVLHDVTALRRLEQVRTAFVANVSHELRTPLTAIQGYVETLLTGAADDAEQRRKFLEVVHRHAERLGRLLNDLTDLSNIELGKISLRLEPTRLHEVVASVLAIMRAAADGGHVSLVADVPPGLPPVHADHDRLHQILINLVDNAVKYTPAGGRVTVRAAEAPPFTVEVAVSDTGIGIPARDLPRVTERFYRVDKARSRELGGTGLGLAIVKHLVHVHDGQLAIESEPDRGTTVRFTLRVAGDAGLAAT